MSKFFTSAKELILVLIIWMLVGTDAGLLQLGRVVRYLNGDARLLNLARYGNYCGVGGNGFPVDAVDRCCKIHDNCYSKIKDKYCAGAYGLLVPYHWTKNPESPKAISCENNLLECSQKVCECDRDLSLCFREMSRSYREENVRGEKGLLGFLT